MLIKEIGNVGEYDGVGHQNWQQTGDPVTNGQQSVSRKQLSNEDRRKSSEELLLLTPRGTLVEIEDMAAMLRRLEMG